MFNKTDGESGMKNSNIMALALALRNIEAGQAVKIPAMTGSSCASCWRGLSAAVGIHKQCNGANDGPVFVGQFQDEGVIRNHRLVSRKITDNNHHQRRRSQLTSLNSFPSDVVTYTSAMMHLVMVSLVDEWHYQDHFITGFQSTRQHRADHVFVAISLEQSLRRPLAVTTPAELNVTS
jgi:hypothetical protein